MIKTFTAAVMLTAFSVSQAQGEDWPQWGGANRDHVSKEKGLLQKWPEGGPKKIWMSKEGGIGYAGISIAKGTLYTMGARGGSEYLIALNEKDGTEKWAAPLGSTLKNGWGDGPRGTPTVVDDKVYALGGDGTLIAVNAADGKQLWKKTMESLGGKVPGWGYTESVLVENGLVFCTPGGSKGAVAALDVATGEVKWQSKDFTDEAQYASITPTDLNGKRQLIQLVMKRFVGLDAKSGDVLWESKFPGDVAVIPSPVVKGNNVYITAGYKVGCKMVKVDGQNKVEDVYQNKVMINHHGGVVLVDGHVYGHSDGKGWVCQEFASGNEVWADKSLGKGAVTYADGRLYCLEEGKGLVVLAEASPKGWTEHGRFVLEPQTEQRNPRGRIWVHPVIANGKLYLRDQELIFSYDISGKQVASR